MNCLTTNWSQYVETENNSEILSIGKGILSGVELAEH
jgi:hypothetical protein